MIDMATRSNAAGRAVPPQPGGTRTLPRIAVLRLLDDPLGVALRRRASSLRRSPVLCTAIPGVAATWGSVRGPKP